MITIKNEEDISLLREGGAHHALLLKELQVLVRPGVRTCEFEEYVLRRLAELGDKPSFLNYRPRGYRTPYPAALCVSVNEEVVHGIPGERVLVEGDIVTLDLGLVHEGMYLDAARTYPVGTVSDKALALIRDTVGALEQGIAAAQAGAYTGDIGAAISSYAKKKGLAVIKDLAGHGVGYAVHEDPEVPNYGRPGTGEKLLPGMVIAIEPMLSLGDTEVLLSDDEYTFSTLHGVLSSHAEDTILITSQGPEVLTQVHE